MEQFARQKSRWAWRRHGNGLARGAGHAVAEERQLHGCSTHAICVRLTVRLAVVRGPSGAGAEAGIAEARRARCGSVRVRARRAVQVSVQLEGA